MKVYVVMAQDWDDRFVVTICSTEELAGRELARAKKDDEYRRMELWIEPHDFVTE